MKEHISSTPHPSTESVVLHLSNLCCQRILSMEECLFKKNPKNIAANALKLNLNLEDEDKRMHILKS